MCSIGGVCRVYYYQDSNRIVQHCAYSILFRIGCTQHNYNIMGYGDSLCCVEDYCNSEEIFLKFRANLSATTANNVGQVTSSTNKLTSTTSWIPTALPTGEFS